MDRGVKMTTAIHGTGFPQIDSNRSISDNSVSINDMNRYLLLNNSLAALGSMGAAAPAAASDWDPSKLNEAWADMEAGGLCALLHRLVGSGAFDQNDPYIISLRQKLEALIDKATKLDNSVKEIAQKMDDILKNPDAQKNLNDYWVATTPDGKDGPITLVFKALEGVLESDPSDMHVQDGDDGFGMFCATSLFADYGSSGIDTLSDAMHNYFDFYDGGIAGGSVLYARQMAWYLSTQGLSADEMTKIYNSFKTSSTDAVYQKFLDKLEHYLTEIQENGGSWPSDLGDPEDVEGDAASLWDNFVDKQ